MTPSNTVYPTTSITCARALFILVASPEIFDVYCKSPQQMALANPWCRYLELAKVLKP